MNFVTGGSGLLGTRILFDLINSGEEVVALKREGTDLKTSRKVFEFLSPKGNDLFDKINWITGDIDDMFSFYDALATCNRVYHAAAVVSFHRKDAELLKKINIIGTENLVNACLDLNIEKFCHISSTAAIGRTKSDMRITEKNDWKDSQYNTKYAVSKYEAEMQVWRGVAEGLDAIIVNPSVILGPGSVDRSSGALIKMINKGMPFYPAGRNAFVSSSDVSRACLKLMKSEIKNERFLVAGENLEFRELFNLIADALDKKRPSFEAKKWMLRLGRTWEGLIEFLGGPKAAITAETILTSGGRYYYSSEKLKSAIDFEFSSMESTVNEVAQFISVK